MKIVVRAVGRLRDPRIEGLCREYLGRARRHLPVEVQEVQGEKDPGQATEQLLRNLPAGAELVALEPGGDAWTTAELATYVEKRMTQGSKALVFLIGAADGLPGPVVAASHRRLSLSPLTLPHRLARLVLCEQIYRVLSRIRGEPYDR